MRCDGSMSSTAWLEGRQVPSLLSSEKGEEKLLPTCVHGHVAKSNRVPLSAWTKIFISVMTSALIAMLRTEPLLAETPDKKDGLAGAIHSRFKP